MVNSERFENPEDVADVLQDASSRYCIKKDIIIYVPSV